MVIGVGLGQLDGFPFEVRYSDGMGFRAQSLAEIARDAYDYLSHLFGGIEPDIALIVANREDWQSRQPYGLPFFNDDERQIRPGILVMPTQNGDFWNAIADDLLQASPREFQRIATTYPDGNGGVNLQPFFDLITLHELGHAFEVLGDLNLPTFWLGEIFANLAMHVFVATQRPDCLATLEALPEVGAASRPLMDRMKAEGYTTLEDLERHYTGGADPMETLNYVWYQYRWQRIAAAIYDAEGEESLVRFWNCFRSSELASGHSSSTEVVAELLTSEVSETLGRAIKSWQAALG